MNLANGLSILFILSRNQPLALLIFAMVSFVSFAFISALIFKISFLLQCVKVKSESEVAQSCPTLSDPMDCSLPGSSVHGIFQARVLEWGAIAFSGIVY